MKKIVSLIIVSVMLVSALTVAASAVTADEWNATKVTQVLQFGSKVNYATDEDLEYGEYCMRGFAVSPDGKYIFAGLLNPKNCSALVMFDTHTASAAGYYVYYQPEDQQTSYPKGLDCDDRGYVYVGLAYLPNNGVARMAVLKYDEKDAQTGFLKQVSVTEVVHEDEPGKGAKVGVNGLKVKAVGSGYYAYVVINYEVDYLYRFDVTNPEAPVLDKSFGKEGRIVLGDDAFKINGEAITEGNYLDVDDDGTVYLAVTTSSKQYLAKISADGSSILQTVEQRKAYAVALWENDVICSSQNAPNEIIVYNKLSLEKTAEFTIGEENTIIPGGANPKRVEQDLVNSVCNLKIAADCIWFGDQGSGQGDVEQAFVAPLNATGKTFVDELTDSIAKSIAASLPADTSAVVTEAETTPEATEPETTPEATEAATTPEATAAQTTPETEPAKKSSGCGSSVAAIAVLLPLAAAVSIRKRKK